jgi:hypothetical protein
MAFLRLRDNILLKLEYLYLSVGVVENKARIELFILLGVPHDDDVNDDADRPSRLVVVSVGDNNKINFPVMRVKTRCLTSLWSLFMDCSLLIILYRI